MAKVEEDIICNYCDSEFTITYNEDKTYGKIELCPFCGEQLDEEPEEDEELDE